MVLTEYGKRTFPRLKADKGAKYDKWWPILWGEVGPHSPLVNFLNSFPWEEDDGLGVDAFYTEMFKVCIDVTEASTPKAPIVLEVIEWCLHHRHAKKVLVMWYNRWPPKLPAEVSILHDDNWETEGPRAELTKFDFIISVCPRKEKRILQRKLDLYKLGEIIISNVRFSDTRAFQIGCVPAAADTSPSQ